MSEDKKLLENQVNIWNKAASAALADGEIDKTKMKTLKESLGNLPFDMSTKNKKEMTESHLNMWRLVASAVHADEYIDSEEVQQIEKYLQELNFNEEQKEIIRKELKSPSPLEEILEKITEPGDRSQSVYLVQLLLWKDKILTDTEETFLKKVRDHFTQFPEIKNIQSELNQLKEKTSHAEELVYSLKNSSVVQFLKKLTSFSKTK